MSTEASAQEASASRVPVSSAIQIALPETERTTETMYTSAAHWKTREPQVHSPGSTAATDTASHGNHLVLGDTDPAPLDECVIETIRLAKLKFEASSSEQAPCDQTHRSDGEQITIRRDSESS